MYRKSNKRGSREVKLATTQLALLQKFERQRKNFPHIDNFAKIAKFRLVLDPMFKI